MYLSDAEEIFVYWERHPPTYQMVSVIAQFLGWKPVVGRVVPISNPPPARPARQPMPAPSGSSPPPSNDFAVVAALPGMETAPLPDWARGAVMDFEEIRRKRLDTKLTG